jgi:hypothetical protein
MPNFPTQQSPVRRRRFARLEIPGTSGLSTSKSHSEEISLTWFDIGEPLLIHSQPNQIPNRRYGVCTVLIPALGTRLARNGIEAKGQSWPREREGRPFSTSALAFSESWTNAV